jgi:predicted nuclease of predicted toxin-antitoxin system
LRPRLFIDECLSASLVALAEDAGIPADFGSYIGASGWPDRRIARFALENEYVVVTNDRRHFLKAFAQLDVHPGLVVIVPNVKRAEQGRLLLAALHGVLIPREDMVNLLVEVLHEGSLHIRPWSRDEHDLSHIDSPGWEPGP